MNRHEARVWLENWEEAKATDWLGGIHNISKSSYAKYLNSHQGYRFWYKMHEATNSSGRWTRPSDIDKTLDTLNKYESKFFFMRLQHKIKNAFTNKEETQTDWQKKADKEKSQEILTIIGLILGAILMIFTVGKIEHHFDPKLTHIWVIPLSIGVTFAVKSLVKHIKRAFLD